MQVWVTARGRVVSIASGRSFSPSHTTMHTSVTPWFFNSVSTCSQYLAPSPPSPAHSPRSRRRVEARSQFDGERLDVLRDRVHNGVVEKFFNVLPDETWVYPGHGRGTTLGDERPHLAEWRERGW